MLLTWLLARGGTLFHIVDADISIFVNIFSFRMKKMVFEMIKEVPQLEVKSMYRWDVGEQFLRLPMRSSLRRSLEMISKPRMKRKWGKGLISFPRPWEDLLIRMHGEGGWDTLLDLGYPNGMKAKFFIMLRIKLHSTRLKAFDLHADLYFH